MNMATQSQLKTGARKKSLADRSLIPFLKAQKDEFRLWSDKVAQKANPSSVHALRVCIRRLRSVLWILKRSAPKIQFKNLDSKLANLGEILGEIRELDVAIKDAQIYAMKSSALKRDRRSPRKLVRRSLSPVRRSQLYSKIAHVEEVLNDKNPVELKKAFGLLQQRLGDAKDTHKYSGPELHRLRITLKKTRYALEALGKTTKPLREIQNALGRVHDLQVLEHLLGKNKRLTKDQKTLTKKAIPLIKPALRFASTQLNELSRSHSG